MIPGEHMDVDIYGGTTIQGNLTTFARGASGMSAYEVAVANGFVGTEEEWLASLAGESAKAEAYAQQAATSAAKAKGSADDAAESARQAAAYRDGAQEIKAQAGTAYSQYLHTINEYVGQANASAVAASASETTATMAADRAEQQANHAELMALFAAQSADRAFNIVSGDFAEDYYKKDEIDAQNAAIYQTIGATGATLWDEIQDTRTELTGASEALHAEITATSIALHTEIIDSTTTLEGDILATSAALHTELMRTSNALDTEIDTRIAALVDSSPEALDTLKELADALGDDPNFATTVANQIGEKLDKTAQAVDSAKLGGTAAASYALKTDVPGLSLSYGATEPTGSKLWIKPV